MLNYQRVDWCSHKGRAPREYEHCLRGSGSKTCSIILLCLGLKSTTRRFHIFSFFFLIGHWIEM